FRIQGKIRQGDRGLRLHPHFGAAQGFFSKLAFLSFRELKSKLGAGGVISWRQLRGLIRRSASTQNKDRKKKKSFIHGFLYLGEKPKTKERFSVARYGNRSFVFRFLFR